MKKITKLISYDRFPRVKERKIQEDPFIKVREKYGYPFASLKMVQAIRKAREERYTWFRVSP